MTAVNGKRVAFASAARYGLAILVCAAVVVVATPLRGPLDRASIVMLFLVGVFGSALWLGRGPGVTASVLSVVLFDFFFVPPRFTFSVAEPSSLVTFTVMLAVALITAALTSRVRRQARLAAERARESQRLYEVARRLAGASSVDEIRAALDASLEAIARRTVVCLSDPAGEFVALGFDPAASMLAQTAVRTGEPVELSGLGDPEGPQVLVPLRGPTRGLGVLGLLTRPERRLVLAEERNRLLTLAGLAALALERALLADQARKAQLAAETEATRNALLAAISHELRTPLTMIVGASSSLAAPPHAMPESARRELAETIAVGARRMSEVVTKILDLARLQAGATRIRPEWNDIEEVIGSALARVAGQLAAHHVATRLPQGSKLARFDAVLIEQLLINLLENAAKYTPAGTHVAIEAERSRDELAVSVADDGPGLPAGQEGAIFDKFHRGAPESAPGGAGLGLAICEAIVEAHGGRIWAETNPGGGAVFRFTLPQAEEPPELEVEQ